MEKFLGCGEHVYSINCRRRKNTTLIGQREHCPDFYRQCKLIILTILNGLQYVTNMTNIFAKHFVK